MNRTQTQPVIFRGGLNLSASVLELQPGECTQLFNYEVNTLGRYQRILGFERFDGRPAPSEVDPTLLVGFPFADDAAQLTAVEAERATRRTAIGTVPGSGDIRGVVSYGGNVYAFRDNAGGTACVMHKATASGWTVVTTPALSPGGRYEFRIANFGASSSTIKLYGVDGVNKLFEFDGTTFTQITGPVAGKEPEHLEVTASQVMLMSYSGGTFVFSAVGDPTDFTVGGGEIGTGDEITSLDLQTNNSVAVFCRNRTYVLYGTSKTDFQLRDLSKSTGAVEWSTQTLGDSVFVDDQGMARLNRVEQFGDFDSATISQKVESLMQTYARRIVASFVIKEKNQVRLCFDDGLGLITTFSGKEVAGFSTFDYGKTFACAFTGEDGTGSEVIYFGSTDGYVYQAEKGFSFDGTAITHACRPAFNNIQSPEIKKRWKKLILEIETAGTATVSVTPEFDYSDPDEPYHDTQTITAIGGGGFWDQGSWDESVWNAAQTYTGDIYIDGVARNMSPVISGSSTTEPPYILNTLIVHYSPRGRRR